MATVAEARAKYKVVLWNRQSPINGVSAADVLAARSDIPPNGAIYLVIDTRTGTAVYFQPHKPRVGGIVPMTEAEALQHADECVLSLACAELPIAATATPNPTTVNATVTVTASLPADTPDTTVVFQVEGGQQYTEPIANGQASHSYAFTLPSTYRVMVSSAHHGQAVVEVVVQ